MNRVLGAIVLLLAISLSPAFAQMSQGEPGPRGQRLPAWLRLVDHDGQVIDIHHFHLDGIALCPTRGDASIWSHDDGAGQAIVDSTAGQLRMSYAFKTFNDGAVTDNPDTTGDQVLLVQDGDVVFQGGAEQCVRFGYGSR